MRYIDADKLHEHITTNHCGECGIYNGEICCSCPMDKALNYIEDAPTADVVPRAEVAREIFGALERTPMFADYDTDGERILCFYAQEYDELKKKYTEAEAEPPKESKR